MKTACANCGEVIANNEIHQLLRLSFCAKCIALLEGKRLVAKSWGLFSLIPNGPRNYELTKRGAAALPGFKIVARCPQDGMPIYQRWVDAGISRVGEDAACPYCMGKAGEMTKYKIPDL